MLDNRHKLLYHTFVNICSISGEDCEVSQCRRCRLPGLTALLGPAPCRCTRVTIYAVDDDMALVHAQTAWHDTGWRGPACRVVPVSALHDFAEGWGTRSHEEAVEAARALLPGWGRLFRSNRKE